MSDLSVRAKALADEMFTDRGLWIGNTRECLSALVAGVERLEAGLEGYKQELHRTQGGLNATAVSSARYLRERDELVGRNEQLQTTVDEDLLYQRKLEAEREQLVAALRFYQEPANYSRPCGTTPSSIEMDCGRRAEKALASLEDSPQW